MKNIASNVKILTDGNKIKGSTDFETITTKIREIKGDTKVRTIEFEDDSTLEVDGIFVALGEAGRG